MRPRETVRPKSRTVGLGFAAGVAVGLAGVAAGIALAVAAQRRRRRRQAAAGREDTPTPFVTGSAEQALDAELDEELKQTFPASDPLPYSHRVD